jgi:hypothetical protein
VRSRAAVEREEEGGRERAEEGDDGRSGTESVIRSTFRTPLSIESLVNGVNRYMGSRRH